MKKNWALFFLICGITYVWLFWTQHQKQQAYEEAYKAYEIEWTEWKEQQDEAERLRNEGREKLREVRESLGTSTEDGDTSPSADQATPEDKPSQSISQYERDLIQDLRLIEDAGKVTVDTGLYRVQFTQLGARVIDWEIKPSEFVSTAAENGEGERSVYLVPILGEKEDRAYPLSFTGDTARDFNNEIFDVERREQENATALTFTSAPVNGLVVVKDFIFYHDSYVVDLDVSFRNGPETGKPLGGNNGFGIGWQGGFGQPHERDRVHGYGEEIVIAVDDGLKTRKVGRNDDMDIFRSPGIDWAGQEKKFFAALIIPEPINPVDEVRISFDPKNDAPAYQADDTNLPLDLDMLHPPRKLEPSERVDVGYQLYVGPKNLEALGTDRFQVAEGTTHPKDLVFHKVPLGMGFLRPLCLLLLGLMRQLQEWIGIWGVAIIATTIIVRIVIYPLTHWAIKNQARTMIEQKKIRPEMEAITKKYKSDPMKRNQAVMQLYREHNVNPLGMFRGCVPMLLQMPVFLALYVVFEQSVELRGQSFLWIPDLSGPDRLIDWGASLPLLGSSFNLLPVLMGATNLLQMRIMRMPATDATQERIQKQMTTLMPIMFVFFLYHLPAGLILYWIVSNCVSIFQSLMTKRIISAHMAEHESEQDDQQNQKSEEEKKKVQEGALT